MNKKYLVRFGATAMTAVLLAGQTGYANVGLNSAFARGYYNVPYVNEAVLDGLNSSRIQSKTVSILDGAEPVEDIVIEEVSDSAVAGMALMVSDYYDAVYSGDVDEAVVKELDALVSDEAAKKLEAFEAYDNLGIANVDTYLNVRAKADKSSKIIGKMVGKSGCEILDYVDGWYYIQSGTVKGYVSAEYIAVDEEAKQIAIEEAKLRAVVNVAVLNVREEPNTDCKVVEKVGNDERYSVLDQIDGWVKISIDGNEGYVSDEYVDVRYALLEAVEFTPVDAKSSFRSSIVDYALQFLGNPYVWGGSSLTRGTDCSGFTMSVYRHFGISLSHSSRAQAGEGRSISTSELRPGDLIFYGGGTINHVAMYIGGGKIIHASDETTGIIISRYNNRTPVKCVNVIGD